MTAAALTPPAQPPLAGLPRTRGSAPSAEPPALERQLAAGDPLKCGFLGLLAEDARAVPDGLHTRIEVTLQQHIPGHPQALPLVAAWQYPDAPDPVATLHRAQALAARMRAGAAVMVVGHGLECAHAAGAPVLRVLKVLSIRPESDMRGDARKTAAPTPADQEPHLC